MRFLLLPLLLLSLAAPALAQMKFVLQYQDQFGKWHRYQEKHNEGDAYRTASLRPLPAPGERFPVDDPELLPVLEPRPVSDALYLHGLLEGLAEIEAQGWQRLNELGAAAPRRIISIGGGARNPQWRRLRERRLGCAVTSCQTPPAAGVARLAQQALVG